MSLPVLFHCTVVPTFTQKSELLLAFGMSGVDEAAFAVRFTSTTHGVEAEPHVLAALHNCAGFASAQAYLLLFDWAVAQEDHRMTGNNSEVPIIAKHRFVFIIRLIMRISDRLLAGGLSISMRARMAWQQTSNLPS
jgi:hypothetical protein